MSYMAKGPPTKDQPPNASGRPSQGPAPLSGQTPQLDPNNAFQQTTQQQLYSSIQQQIYMTQATGQVLAHPQNWGSLTTTTHQQTVSSNVVPALAAVAMPPQVQHQQSHQNQGNALYPATAQQQQQQPNITISRVSAPPTSVHQTQPAVTVTNHQSLGNNQSAGSAQIPITQPLAPTTTGPVVATQNNTGMQAAVSSPAKSTSAVVGQSSPLSVTQAKVSTTPVSNNVASSKPPALAPITQTPPKPQVQTSLGAKPVESPNKSPGITPLSTATAKSVTTPGKETVLPARPISHQNTSSISIVQKTPTKSTLKLATVTPRIKTTPKKSPTTPTVVAPPLQRSPHVSPPVSSNTNSNTDRPNALIKSKESVTKSVTALATPAKLDQKAPAPVKTPEVIAKTVNSSPPPVTNQSNSSPPATNNVTPPQKKEVKEAKSVTKDSNKTETGKKEPQSETPKVPPPSSANNKEPSLTPKPEKESEKAEKEVKEKVVAVPQPKIVEKKEPTQTKSETTKKEKSQVATPAKAKLERKPAQTPVAAAAVTPKEPKPSTSHGPDGSTGRTRRARKGVQPFQSPIPEIENAKKASINEGASTSKEPTEKLIIFYK